MHPNECQCLLGPWRDSKKKLVAIWRTELYPASELQVKLHSVSKKIFLACVVSSVCWIEVQ